MNDRAFDLVSSLAKVVVVVPAILGVVALMSWVERRLSAVIQFRWGPNRVGPLGLFQPIADGIKFAFKEDIAPADANKVLFSPDPEARQSDRDPR